YRRRRLVFFSGLVAITIYKCSAESYRYTSLFIHQSIMASTHEEEKKTSKRRSSSSAKKSLAKKKEEKKKTMPDSDEENDAKTSSSTTTSSSNRNNCKWFRQNLLITCIKEFLEKHGLTAEKDAIRNFITGVQAVLQSGLEEAVVWAHHAQRSRDLTREDLFKV